MGRQTGGGVRRGADAAAASYRVSEPARSCEDRRQHPRRSARSCVARRPEIPRVVGPQRDGNKG
eukprot:543338-Pyramimonas_sp.AAC.1